MTDALMVAMALGVAAWVLAPLFASMRGGAMAGRQTRPQPGARGGDG